MVNLKAMEFCNLKMEAFIKVNSAMVKNMDKESLHSRKMENL
jgi:hypothetical protein